MADLIYFETHRCSLFTHTGVGPLTYTGVHTNKQYYYYYALTLAGKGYHLLITTTRYWIGMRVLIQELLVLFHVSDSIF